MASGNFLRTIRISLMFYMLAFVAMGAWLAKARSTDWNDTLWVNVYPIAANGSPAVERYMSQLEAEDFGAIEEFLQREASRYGIELDSPLRVDLGDPVEELPPAPPADGNPLAVIGWSLQLRYWAWQVQRKQNLPSPDIKVFVVYHDPTTERLPHSLGLQKGLIGVVNAFATRQANGSNNVVIAHEIMHTLGASDKYDLATNQPLHPHGYAEPARKPLHPQRHAELMGGRIPLSEARAATPPSLAHVVVGKATAQEIRWIN